MYLNTTVDEVYHCDATPAVLNPPLSDTILHALKDSREIHSLYTHQVAAITALDQGKNVIVSTSTASGKSAIYQAGFSTNIRTDIDNHGCLGACAKVSRKGSRCHRNFCVPDKGNNLFLMLIWEVKGHVQALAQDQRAALEQLLCSCPGLEHVKVTYLVCGVHGLI
jgi:DEAD/DEAH box helicase domain-containing protein